MFLSLVFELLYVDFNSVTKPLIRFINFFTSFSMMALFIIVFKKDRVGLDKFIRHFVIVVTIFGIYQLIARVIGFPLGVLEHNQFRDFGYLSQATSFFREPRFYGAFLSVFLYVVLFYYKRKDRLILISLLVLSVFLTQSVTAFFLLVIVGLSYAFKNTNIMALFKIIGFSFVSVIALSYVEIFSARLNILLNIDFVNLFSYILDANLSQAPGNISEGSFRAICPSNAGCASTAGEMWYLIKVLATSPFVGYGVGYGFGDIYRVMALNGVTEFILRWGVLGIALFLLAISRNCRNKFRFVFVILAYMSALGNLGQPLFWCLISLIHIMHSRSFIHRAKTTFNRVKYSNG
tara:strand:+ start:353 stop:1399 length:1047 start_codon:yes stop_codon:yes gene_type:complete